MFHKLLGSGGFGAVVGPALPNTNDRGEPVYFPEHVTKVFFDNDSKNRAIESSRRIAELFGGNNGSFRVNTYGKDYTFGNLKGMANVNHKLKNELDKKGFINNDELQLLRLPNLGVDFNDGLYKNVKSVRNVPVITMLQQFRKLFYQTTSLAGNKYIHGDVRSGNLLIQPNNGTISIIDFDWLMPYVDFFDAYSEAFGFYSNPPEFLLFNKFKFFDVFDETKDPEEIVRSINISDYVKFTKQDFLVYTPLNLLDIELDLKIDLIENIQYIRSHIPYTHEDAATVAAGKSLRATPENNAAMMLIKYRLIGRIINLLFPYFDNYGLANCLLKFMNLVYVYSRKATITNFPHILKTRLTNNGVPYSHEELVRISQALIDVGKLLTRVSSFSISERLLPADILAEMDAIIARYQSSAPEDPLAAVANAPEPAEANNPVAYNINVPMGGGHRHRRNRTNRRVRHTRRLHMRRRKTNRRK